MRILIADDHPIVLEALQELLCRTDPTTQILRATSGQEVFGLLQTNGIPDLILLDYLMPGMGDMGVIGEIHASYPTARIAIISGQEDPLLAEDAISRGALGFIPKTMSPTTMMHAIRMMAEGGRYFPDFLMDWRSRPKPRSTSSGSGATEERLFGLTDRELDSVRELVQGRSNKEIARNLHIEEVTVKLHLRRAYKKMNAHNRADAVRIALAAGINSGLN